MKVLDQFSFESARAFILDAGRPLERALLKYHIEGGKFEAVMQALGEFQNDDGGFGRALEPDLRTPTSSALATGIALRHLVELGAPASSPMVTNAIDYLLRTFDEQEMVWPVVPGDSNDYAHAPWWHDENGSRAETFSQFVIIPRAEIVASLHAYEELVERHWLDKVTASTVEAIEMTPLGEGGGDDLVYAIRLAEAKGLDSGMRSRVVDCVTNVALQVVTRDADLWENYCIPPLKLAPRPDSLLASSLADDVARNLDYLIQNQTADGAWNPSWSWGGAYPDIWPLALSEWRGELTLEALLTLKRFGRIEGISE